MSKGCNGGIQQRRVNGATATAMPLAPNLESPLKRGAGAAHVAPLQHRCTAGYGGGLAADVTAVALAADGKAVAVARRRPGPYSRVLLLGVRVAPWI